MSDYSYLSRNRILEELHGRSAGIRKKLGQNFLVDPNHIRLIAARTLDCGGESLLEIGPGLGALTHIFLENGRHVTAVEIDAVLCDILQEKYGSNPLFTLIPGDALDLLKSDATLPPVVCGNLPYYISTDLLTAIVRRGSFRCGVFLVQSEFAERASGRSESSSIHVFLSNFGEWKILHRVPRRSFFPAPDVESSLLGFTSFDAPLCDAVVLESLLRKSFLARRKKILNSWKISSPEEAQRLAQKAHSLSLDTALRAEEWKREDFYSLARSLANPE